MSVANGRQPFFHPTTLGRFGFAQKPQCQVHFPGIGPAEKGGLGAQGGKITQAVLLRPELLLCCGSDFDGDKGAHGMDWRPRNTGKVTDRSTEQGLKVCCKGLGGHIGAEQGAPVPFTVDEKDAGGVVEQIVVIGKAVTFGGFGVQAIGGL